MSEIKAAVQRGLSLIGMRQSSRTIEMDAQAYWRGPNGDRGKWEADSHFRNADPKLWDEVGMWHLAYFEECMRLRQAEHLVLDRILEWGCGGGANLSKLAQYTSELVGVDISEDALVECGQQIEATNGGWRGNFRPVQVSVTNPERALEAVPSPVEVVLCFYVLELVPTPEYGQRLLGIFHALLRRGGMALIQVKYTDGSWRTKPLRRGYKDNVAQMTSYPILDFQEIAEQIGFQVVNVKIVPKHVVDERYAYFMLVKP